MKSAEAKVKKGGQEVTRLFYRPREVAQILSVSLPFVYQLTKRGDIRSVRFGKSVRIPVAEVNRIVAEGLPEA